MNVEALVIGIGAVTRQFHIPWLVNVMTPQVAPDIAMEFIGDLLIAIGGTLLVLGLLDWVADVPELVWQAFGALVVLAVITTPKLAGLYFRVRTRAG
jgi:hypothetical protein